MSQDSWEDGCGSPIRRMLGQRRTAWGARHQLAATNHAQGDSRQAHLQDAVACLDQVFERGDDGQPSTYRRLQRREVAQG